MAELAAGVEGRDERGGRPKPPRTECPAHLRSGTGFPARVRVRRIRGLDSRRHCGLCHHPAHSLRPQLQQARAHLGRDFAAGQARPQDFPKTIRHERVASMMMGKINATPEAMLIAHSAASSHSRRK